MLWQKAYSTFWRSSADEISRLYKVENPPFPDTGTLPDKYFPQDTYATWIVQFFIKLSAMVNVSALEKGLDYVIEATYDEDAFTFKQQKEDLFYILYLVEKNIANRARTSGVRDNSTALPVYYDFITRIFPDTILVDTIAAIRQLHASPFHYPFHQEVKGITRGLVDSVINSPPQETPPTLEATALPTESAAAEQPQPQNVIFVPRSLWDGKTEQAARDNMREQGFKPAVIAHVLHYWCGVANRTQLGRLLGPLNLTDRTYLRNADKLLAEAAALNIQPV